MQPEEITNSFPTGLAMGKAFINREQERAELKKNILARRHTVLMAPRRHGKTSLVKQISEEIKMPFCVMDMLAVHNEESVRDIFVDKVGQLIMEMLPRLRKAKETLFHIFENMKPELSLGALGQKLTLHLPPKAAVSHITDLLLKLDETAGRFKKTAIVFIDEMQQIHFLKNAHSIEAAIRHAVERSKNIVYCFSGSSRHLLKKMFGSKNRPLYRLCHTFEIGRMAESHYQTHLNQLAKSRWGHPLTADQLEKIFTLTERHPFYMNALCQCVWMEEKMPTGVAIETIWKTYIYANRQIIVEDVMNLSLNQKRILAELARCPVKEPYHSEFLSKTKLSPSSIRKAFDVLLAKDMIYRADDLYTLIDPAIKYYLATGL